MRIEILFVAGCPNHAGAVRLVRAAMDSLGLDAEVYEVEVKDTDDAERLRFFGSPTIRVNGRDIDPAARDRTDHSFSCRIYGRSGSPPRELVERAMLAASRQ